MKIKGFISITIAFAAIFFIACNDDLDEIGSSVQPGGDDIQLYTDTVTLTATTISLKDSVPAPNKNALLGTMRDDLFGELRSDYLTEFWAYKGLDAELIKHKEENNFKLDSAHVYIFCNNLKGEEDAPMDISIYEVTTDLKADFYTDIKPSDYCDMSKVLGKRFFTFKDLPTTEANKDNPKFAVKRIDLPIAHSHMTKLYDAWDADHAILSSPEKLKEQFKGIYVTNNTDSKTMIDILQTSYCIYYSYDIRNHNNTADSTLVRTLLLPSNEDVLQINSVRNSKLDKILNNAVNTKQAFIKAPAGVATRVTIPLKAIMDKTRSRDGFSINSASFKMMGATEDEKDLSIEDRPSALLFINEDSVATFFGAKDNKKKLGTNTIVMMRGGNNTYNFSNRNTTSISNNISILVNSYIKEMKEDPSKNITELNFLLIPVDLSIVGTEEVKEIQGVSHTMRPSAAILRTEKKYMKMPLVFSRYNNIRQ